MPASSPWRLFEIFDLEAVLLGPARIHAQQHRGPVLALGAAGAGMHFEIGIEAVGLARQQRFELAARDFLLQGLQRGLGFGHDAVIVLGLAELDHPDIVLELALDLADAASASSSEVRSCISFWAFWGSFQRLGSSASLFSSASRAVDARRQRCLLSSPTDCLISSTRRSTSARMVSLICGGSRYLTMLRRDVAAHAAKRNPLEACPSASSADAC